LDDYDLQPTAQRRYSNGGYTGKRGPFSFCKFQLLILSEYIFENIEYRAIPDGIINSCLIPIIFSRIIMEIFNYELVINI